jgi:hypothetical protein
MTGEDGSAPGRVAKEAWRCSSDSIVITENYRPATARQLVGSVEEATSAARSDPGGIGNGPTVVIDRSLCVPEKGSAGRVIAESRRKGIPVESGLDIIDRTGVAETR